MHAVGSRKFNDQIQPSSPSTPIQSPLDLHLIQSVLPDGDKGSDSILAVVEEDNPMGNQYMPSGGQTLGRLTCHRGPWTRQSGIRSP